MQQSELEKIEKYLDNMGFTVGTSRDRKRRIGLNKQRWHVNIYLETDSFINVTIFIVVDTEDKKGIKIFHRFAGNVKSFKEFRVVFNATYMEDFWEEKRKIAVEAGLKVHEEMYKYSLDGTKSKGKRTTNRKH